MKTIEQQVQETIILQKVNAVHRGAFKEKFPNQCEHILRLITERLHLCLDKRDGSDPANPDTWRITAEEIVCLAQSMKAIHEIRESLKNTTPRSEDE